MYELAIFIAGGVIGGGIAYSFNEYVWSIAIKSLAEQIPARIRDDVLAAAERAKRNRVEP